MRTRDLEVVYQSAAAIAHTFQNGGRTKEECIKLAKEYLKRRDNENSIQLQT